MKLNSQTRNVDNTFQTESNNFKIKASAKAFKILSDGLYSNKIKAVIRELSCNAYDGHVAANKSDVPFEVHLPNPLEPYFSIQDFGTGMDHDEIMKLYSTYFESTKTNSNEMIGALGLGSKSPFSYTDSFTVVSTKNCVTGTYMCYIDSSMIPVVQVLSEESSDLPNGVEVSFSVKPQDFNEFKRESQIVFRPFAVRPIIRGTEQFVFEEYDIHDTIGDIKIVKNYKWGENQWIAIQGNIEYPLDITKLTNIDEDIATDEEKENVEIISSLFQHMNLVIPFQIGDLDISASRESLGYDKQTIENIAKKVKTILIDIKNKIYDDISSAENEYDMALEFNDACDIFQQQIVVAALRNTEIVEKISEDGSFYIDPTNITQMVHYKDTSYTKIDRCDFLKRSHKQTFKPMKNAKIILNDEKSKSSGITKARKLISEKRESEILLVSQDALQYIGNPNYSRISSYKFEKKKRKSFSFSDGSHFKRYEYEGFRRNSFGQLPQGVKEENEILIVPIINNECEEYNMIDLFGFDTRCDEILKIAKQSGFVNEVYGVRSSHYNSPKFQKFMKNSNFKCVFEKIKEEIDKLVNNSEEIEMLSKYNISKKLERIPTIDSKIFSLIENGRIAFEKDSPIQVAYDNYKQYSDFLPSLEFDGKVWFLEKKEIVLLVQSEDVVFSNNEEFEMLSFLDRWDYMIGESKILKYLGGKIINPSISI